MKDTTKGYIYILLTTVIFSTMEVALKMVAGVFAPMQITVLRFFIGGVCILPFAAAALRKKNQRVKKSDIAYMAFTGLLCVPTSMVLYQMAVGSTKASVVAVVFSGNPIFVMILAGLLLHEVIRKNNIAALLFIVAGILCIADPLHNTLSPVGVLLAVAAAAVFAFYAVMSKRLARLYGGIVSTCGSFLFGSVELFVLLGLGQLDSVAALYENLGLGIFCHVPLLQGINMTTMPYFLYICVINSAMGFVCHQMALQYLDAKTVGLVFFFKPVLAPLLSLAVLGEAITLNMGLGILCFLAGSLISLVPDMLRQKQAQASA